MAAINPFGAPASIPPAVAPGIHIGTVTRLDAPTAYVELPRYAPGYEYPARYATGYTPAPGHQVAAAFIEGDDDELVILIRLAT